MGIIRFTYRKEVLWISIYKIYTLTIVKHTIQKIIREVTINHITFNMDCVIIEYHTNGIKVIMEVPKPYYAITID